MVQIFTNFLVSQIPDVKVCASRFDVKVCLFRVQIWQTKIKHLDPVCCCFPSRTCMVPFTHQAWRINILVSQFPLLYAYILAKVRFVFHVFDAPCRLLRLIRKGNIFFLITSMFSINSESKYCTIIQMHFNQIITLNKVLLWFKCSIYIALWFIALYYDKRHSIRIKASQLFSVMTLLTVYIYT